MGASEGAVGASGAAVADLPPLDAPEYAGLAGVERPFLEYWWAHVLDPRDPQRRRWLEREAKLPELALAWVDRLGEGLALAGARVLDVGCQNGATLVALARRGAVPAGIELDARCVEAARIRVRCHGVAAEVRQGSACAMPYADGVFDGVLASNVVEHVDDPAALVRECARVLRPGGVLYLDGPNRFAPRWLRGDPHYQLAGVSVLPARWARAYVTRVRGFPAYDAETFPTASGTRRALAGAGLNARTIVHREPAWLPGPLRALAGDLRGMFYFLAEKPAR